ncbi:TonB-dependent receptor [Lutibacter sp. Hel_I_33_5]|uniref:TonB-dependent receptor n=1 Tax=Lutibacter sp. Hel_I_33_5 TaxID=1566289 RepID=UPI00119CF54D|nr:TonB-dependent receptor [Lutibacter sp. Hel_I_33_5]TVZ56459.1 TonB-dependent receptor [Lutibacter sp. Hel_I_33_5]
MRLLLNLFASVLFSFNMLYGMQSNVIKGIVQDAKTGVYLEGVTIVIEESDLGTFTNENGEFLISNLNAKTVVLTCTYLGYKKFKKKIDLRKITTFTLNIKLEPIKEVVLDEIVIVGYQLQNNNIIKKKAEAIQIADFLIQDDISRYPDFAIADVASRIVGVTANFEEDEATRIGIRGLSPIFTFSSLDGMIIPSAENQTRIANFEAIPSSLINSIEVYKSRTADLDGNAIGGVFNLKTRSAWDSNKTFLNLRSFFGKYNFDEVPRTGKRNDINKNGLSSRHEATFATKFGANKNFGIVLAASYNLKDRDQTKHPKANYSFLDNNPLKPIPSRIRIDSYDNIVERYGGLVKFEYKPENNLYMSFSAGHFVKNDDEIRQGIRFDQLSFDESTASANSVKFTKARSRVSSNIWDINREITNLVYNANYDINSDSKLELMFGWASGKRKQDSGFTEFRGSSIEDNSGFFSSNGASASFSLDDPSTYNGNASNNYYSLNTLNNRRSSNVEKNTSLAINYTLNFKDKNWTLKTGYKFRNLDYVHNDYSLIADYIGGTPLNISDFLIKTNYIPNGTDYAMPLLDPYAINNYITSNSSQFKIPDNSMATIFGRGLVFLPEAEFKIEEVVNAGYISTRYNKDKLKLNFGLRIENTNSKSNRLVNINNQYDGTLSNVNTNYTSFLPSLGMSYNITNKLKFKSAYSKAIGRPDYLQLAPIEIIDEVNNRISKGNPDLKPRIADNLDSFIEFYFGEKNQNLLTLGWFYKYIKDDIINEVSTLGPNQVTTFVNSESSTISGIELNFIKNKLDFLPGFVSNFGISTNYLFIQGKTQLNSGEKIPLVNLPKHTINAQLFYQQNKFDARLSWNWTDNTLESYVKNNELENSYIFSYGTLNFSTRYNIYDNLSVILEVRNLNDANRGSFVGTNNINPIRVDEFGKSFWFGLNYAL